LNRNRYKRKPAWHSLRNSSKRLFAKLSGTSVQSSAVDEREHKPAWRFWVRVGILALLGMSAIYLSLAAVNILILGTDDVDYAQHTDTIMLLHWRPLPRRLSLLSVPRDTQVVLPKRGMLKINAVYAYGNALNGRAYALAMTRSTLENLLGVKVHYVIHIRYSGFIALVDAMGGVPMYIPKRMQYMDIAGGVNIDLMPGYQLLDGRQALNYVRFRHDLDSDLGRMKRQQEFVKAFVSQLMGFTKLPRTIKAFYAFLHQIETDLTMPTAFFLALEMKSVVGYAWQQSILPGQTIYVQGVPYWQIDNNAVKEVMAGLGQAPKPKAAPVSTPESKSVKGEAVTVSNPADQAEAAPIPAAPSAGKKSAAAKATSAPAIAATPAPTAEAKTVVAKTQVGKAAPRVPLALTPAAKVSIPAPKFVKVAWPKGPQPVIRILNGCGAGGVSKTLADKMARQHLRISMKNVGNAVHYNFANTLVRTNAKNLPWARGIAKLLGLKDMYVQLDKDNPAITVIIGKDHELWSK
jgi:LCP family protein required for cell wall assembly